MHYPKPGSTGGATFIKGQHSWLLYLLPLAGVLVPFLYKWSGKKAEAGNNLIVDEIRKPDGGVSTTIVPMVLLTTVITHLFSGAAGCEVTAVQIGGCLFSFLVKKIKVK